MGVLRGLLSVLAVLIVILTAISAVGFFFLGSMQNNSQKSIDPLFIAYGLAGIGVIYALSRRDIPNLSVAIACIWAAPAVYLVLKLLSRVL